MKISAHKSRRQFLKISWKPLPECTRITMIGKKLEIEETEMWNRAWKSAGLVQNNGKKAVIVLASRGVGPTVATRILRKYVRKDSDFYKEILKAEREYQRTRSFWD